MNTTIIEKRNISHDTIFLKIKCERDIKNTDISFFVYIKDDSGRENPYTPVSWTDREIYFIIKIYKRKGVSEYIGMKSVGEDLEISEPISKLKYSRNHKNVLMICGGTGITPMLQILNHEEDISKFTIINCNKSYKDIIINRDIINKDLEIYHILSNENGECEIDNNMYFISENVKKDRLNKEVLLEILGSRKYDFVYVCGPPSFMKDVCGPKTPDLEQGDLEGILKELGYNKDNVYKF